LGLHDNHVGTSLYRINPDGDVVWVNFIPPFTNGNSVQSLSSPRLIKNGYETYILQVDEQFYENSLLYPENFIYKIDSNGSIVLQKRIICDHGKLVVQAISYNENNGKIVLCGYNLIPDVGTVKYSAILLEFDNDFNVVTKYTIKEAFDSDSFISIKDVYSCDDYYIVFGDAGTNLENNFLAKIFPVISTEIDQNVKFVISKKFDRCFFNSNFIYLQKNDRADTFITKLNHNFDLLWNKNFDHGIYNYRAIRQVTPFNIILSNYYIGSLDLNLNSCLTINGDNLTIGNKTFWLTPKFDFSLQNSLNELHSYSLVDTIVSSTKLQICPTLIDDDIPEIKENTYLQSPNFYLQGAGSVGDDSTRGIHLRWTFSGVLGDKHLPKGNYASNSYNFNKPNDFVKLYRTPYVKHSFILNFALPPQTVNDVQKFWLYKFNSNTRIFFVYFKNATKYNLVRTTINPMTNPLEFIQAYGNEVIEVENKRELFFAADLSVGNVTGSSAIKVEGLSVPENKIFVPKSLSYRKQYNSTELDAVRIVCENGRKIRFKAQSCFVSKVAFEFYSDFITATSINNAWQILGDYALTTDDLEAFSRLDPDAENNPVNGTWLRYNDHAYVRTDNYKDKWNGEVELWDRNIKDVVEHYIDLSDSVDNPRAIENVTVNLANSGNEVVTVEQGEPEEGAMEISNLDMLRIASYDYHIARMLGLGTLDLDAIVLEGEYIYLAGYHTFGDLEDGSVGEVHHLSMTLPTSLTTQRLPLPVDLSVLVPGLTMDVETGEVSSLCDEFGYSFDGKERFISIFSEELPEGEINPVFFSNTNTFDSSTFTLPVYAGLEYRKVLPGGTDNGVWEKPELSHKKKYLNIDATFNESYETTSIYLPEPETPLYVHIQKKSGTYYYASYGINWFSRATSSQIVLDIVTDIKPFNSLLPPSNVNPFLIRNENPLMFTSAEEQNKLTQISIEDKTLVRLILDYNADQELINYQIPLDTVLSDSVFESDPDSLFRDSDEIFGDEIEIHFRDHTPKIISAKVIDAIHEHPTNQLLAVIPTTSYYQASTGETLVSELPIGTTSQNFKGGIFSMGEQQYIIYDVVASTGGLEFIVYKKEISNGILSSEIPTVNSQNLELPYYEEDGLFSVVENMQNTTSWGTSTNPHDLKIKIGRNDWSIHRELVKLHNTNGQVEKYIEKTRGFWESATIEKFLEDFTFEPPTGPLISKTQTHRGIYKITFNDFYLENHEQFLQNVQWFNGSVRLFTESNFVGGAFRDSRKVFNVFKTENIGTTNNLVLYINDPSFILDDEGNPAIQNDDILVGNDVLTNYYPSYKAYLYYSPSHNLTEEHILPNEGEGVRYTIFGLRTVDVNTTNLDGSFYKSKFSVPALMFAHEIIEALPPEAPLGGLYATRPDFYGKSTYTMTTKYQHKPHAVSFYRADNQAFLSSLYEVETIKEIYSQLHELGGNEELYFTNRWNNFLDFDTLEQELDYKIYPPVDVSENNYKFPRPNKIKFFEEINNFISYHNAHFNQNVELIEVDDYPTIDFAHIVIPAVSGQNDNIKFIDFVREAIHNAFIPLTEVPIIYKYIKTDANYKPVNKKQTIRDRNGYLLDPTSSSNGFDMAPMMKVIGSNPHETQFTDFTLDGTSSNVYFYAVRELGSQMKMGPLSAILGPIKLVNTNAPEAPKVKSAIPVLENRVLGINPKLRFEIAAYPEVQNIKRINLYRTESRLEAESVQSMKLIKVIDIETANLSTEAIWLFDDNFEDLAEVPFGVPLYYRITVSRKVEYADSDQNVIIEYAPSQVSKIIASMIVESYKPVSPQLKYFSEPLNGAILNGIVLNWEKACFNANYTIYKMNSQGSWIKIYETQTNEDVLYLPLENTNLGTGSLTVLNIDNTPIYHHFKIITENTSGMISSEEKILTIYDVNSWQDIGGIATEDKSEGMIVGHTFVVR